MAADLDAPPAAPPAPARAMWWAGMLPPATRPWTPVERFVFRVVFLYLLLWLLDWFWLSAALWAAPIGTVYHALTGEWLRQAHPYGGEPLLDFLVVYARLGLALVLAVPWTLLERRGGFTERLLWPTHTVLRFWLAWLLLGYGFQKVWQMQMSLPTTVDLLIPYGEMSLMGLLWRTVGASPLFQTVGGWAEVIPGLLLLFRRTTLPGAALAAGVMGYVFLLNLIYAVFVKLLSGHMFVFALLLLVPYLGQLRAVLLNRPATPVPLPAVPQHPLWRWLGWGLRGAAMVYVVLTPLRQAQDVVSKYGAIPTPTPLAGLWDVVQDSRPASALLTEDRRWLRVAVNDTRQASEPLQRVQFMAQQVNGDRWWGQMEVGAGTVDLTDLSIRPRADRTNPTTLAAQTWTWARLPGGQLRLTGQDDGQPWTVVLRPAPADGSFLKTQRSGWVIDRGENR